MELYDFIPKTAKFFISSQAKDYELRTPNIEDRVEMVRICGGEQSFMDAFTNKRWDQICKVVYRLLKDKSDFIARKYTIIDDEGFQKEVIVTGPILLLRALITQQEADGMLGALTAAISESEPLVKEYIQSELKKNLEKSNPSTGEKSLTSSPVNTDTPLSSSDHLLIGS